MHTLELTCGEQRILLPRLALGTGSFGKTVSPAQAFALLDRYRGADGTCIDTARMYADGASEEIIGEYLAQRGCRGQVVLSTKGGFPPAGDMHRSRIRPDALRSDLENSLRALRTDYADVYFLHRDDPSFPVEQLMPFLDGLVRAGVVRFPGASNWTAARIDEANRFAAENGLTPFSISQIQWSLAESTPSMWNDDTIVCMDGTQARFYRDASMPVMAFTPLTRGFFDKLAAVPPGRTLPEELRVFATPRNRERLRRLQEICRNRGATTAQVCHAYITSGSPSGIAVMGAKTLRHLEDSLAGADLVLTEQELAALRADDTTEMERNISHAGLS